ncbi:hypothetical protein MBLNU230_g5805t1 [Neophaeotheca triangularis]
MATPTGTSFLPDLNSTPPMPTFQKPPLTPPQRINTDMDKSITGSRPTTPFPSAHATPNRPVTPSRPLHTPRAPSPLPKSSPPPLPLSQPPARTAARAFATTCIVEDHLQDTPPLPLAWNQAHDRAICVLDARGYDLASIVSKIKRVFPMLKGTLTMGMIDKRLRVLDQRIELDYWRLGLRGNGSGGNVVSHAAGAGKSKGRAENSSPRSAEPGSASSIKAVRSISSLAPVTRTFDVGFRTHLDAV